MLLALAPEHDGHQRSGGVGSNPEGAAPTGKDGDVKPLLPFVSVMADVGPAVAVTADGGIVEGRTEG